MFLYDNFSVNDASHLLMDGVDMAQAAKEFGTPLYVMSEQKIVEKCRKMHAVMRENYGENYSIAYASKALCAKFIYRIIAKENMYIDVVSAGEIYTAVSGGADPKKMHFHGGNKTSAELDYALKIGVKTFVIDNEAEIAQLSEKAARLGVTADVVLRVKPGIDAHTHEFISTGVIDTKFGFDINTEVQKVADKVATQKSLRLVGLHCHIGSQIFTSEPYAKSGDVMARCMIDIERATKQKLTQLIIGGGFGVKYTEDENPEDVGNIISATANAVKAVYARERMDMPHVVIEPGRSIVAEAGITLYTVGGIKNIPDVRTYVTVDGGMTDNPRFALYGAKYTVCLANKAADTDVSPVTVAGKCCESGDIISKDTNLQKAEIGDILASFTTGAYNYSMCSNYNKNPRPAMVLVKDGKCELVVRRETYEDMLRLEV